MPDEPSHQADPVSSIEPDPTPAEVDIAVPPATPSPTPVPIPPADPGYSPSGIPTFDSVREKIETRYGTAIGSAELAAETPEGRTVEEQYEARQRAASDRLEQIKAQMHAEQSGEAGN